MKNEETRSASQRWAEFRLSVIGAVLASPPGFGELAMTLEELSEKTWTHPTTQKRRIFSFSTIERWYYQALVSTQSPIDGLARKNRSDQGAQRAMSTESKDILLQQYKSHGSWSYQLHRDNLKVVLEMAGSKSPSYDSVRRYLQSVGCLKKKRSPNRLRLGYQKSQINKEKVEVRSYENAYVSGLWHLDFHHCSREIMTRHGELVKPLALGIIDDHSRLLCHIQWYLSETTEDLVHGFIQALQKRGLPRSLMTDNGSAMTSHEFTNGLKALSIIHETTLPYSPYQNGKQEVVWGQVEGRLMAMLENKKILTLKELNDATVSWSELEYNKGLHKEISSTPLERFLKNQDVSRPSPELEVLRQAFCLRESRTLRQSDGTISILGKRFEVPNRFCHFKKIVVSFAEWALDQVQLIDPQTGKAICPLYPVNKEANYNNGRKTRQPLAMAEINVDQDEVAPLLMKILGEQAATGLPPAYQPKDEE